MTRTSVVNLHAATPVSNDRVKTYLIAGNPLELCCYNVIRKDVRDGLKNAKIGQSAAKLRIGEGSTTIPEGSRVQVNSKCEVSYFDKIMI